MSQKQNIVQHFLETLLRAMFGSNSVRFEAYVAVTPAGTKDPYSIVRAKKNEHGNVIGYAITAKGSTPEQILQAITDAAAKAVNVIINGKERGFPPQNLKDRAATEAGAILSTVGKDVFDEGANLLISAASVGKGATLEKYRLETAYGPIEFRISKTDEENKARLETFADKIGARLINVSAQKDESSKAERIAKWLAKRAELDAKIAEAEGRTVPNVPVSVPVENVA